MKTSRTQNWFPCAKGNDWKRMVGHFEAFLSLNPETKTWFVHSEDLQIETDTKLKEAEAAQFVADEIIRAEFQELIKRV